MQGNGKHAGIVLHSDMVLIKNITVALGVDEKTLREQMFWEADQFLISSLSDYILEYVKLPLQTQSGNCIYILILVRKGIIKLIRSLLKKVGLSIHNIDVDLFSNIRTLLINYELSKKENSVFIDVQKEYLKLVFIRQNEYYWAHRISLRSQNANAEFLSPSEIVPSLLKEFRRVIFGHRLGRKIEDLDRIFLAGSGSVRKIAEDLTNTISVPVEVLNPFRRLKVSETVERSKEYIRFPELFGASVGIALKMVPALAGS